MNENTQLQVISLEETMALGKVLAESKFFSDSHQVAQAVVKILAGRELGLGPIASMTGVHIIQGKPAVGANLMAAALKRSGRYNYRVTKLDDSVCEIAFFEGGEEIGRSVFDLEDARKAGTKNLEKFPRNMLFARAMSNGVKWFCPDVFGGAPIYEPGELGANVNYETGDIVDVTPTVVNEPTVNWPAQAITAIIAAGIAQHPKHVIAALKLSQFITPADAPDVIVTWATEYRQARVNGSEPEAAAMAADAKIMADMASEEVESAE